MGGGKERSKRSNNGEAKKKPAVKSRKLTRGKSRAGRFTEPKLCVINHRLRPLEFLENRALSRNLPESHLRFLILSDSKRRRIGLFREMIERNWSSWLLAFCPCFPSSFSLFSFSALPLAKVWFPQFVLLTDRPVRLTQPRPARSCHFSRNCCTENRKSRPVRHPRMQKAPEPVTLNGFVFYK